MRKSLIVVFLFILFLSGISFLSPPQPTPVAAQASSCTATSGTGGNVNLRGGPGTNYAVAGQLTPTTQDVITGQIQGADGFKWWRVFSGGWVRSDVASTSGDCSSVPVVNPPPVYCGGRTELADRPTLSGAVERYKTDRFTIHYTLEGDDAATPEFVAEVAAAMEKSWQTQIEEMGWPVPPGDCSEGGDELFDIYLQDVEERLLGYAQPEFQVGDNLNTPEVEIYAAYSHLVLDNDYSASAEPLATMRATAAHEFFHNVQFSYDLAETFKGPDESSAVWMEIQTYPEHDASTFYVSEVMTYPDLCFGFISEERSNRIYGEWLFIDSVVQDFDAESLLKLWRIRAEQEGIETFYNGLQEIGTTAREAVLRMAIRNLLFGYERAPYFNATIYTENWIEGPGDYAPRRDGAQQLSVDYVRILTPALYTFSIDQPNFALYGVGIDRNASQARIFELGQSGAFDSSAFDESYIIVYNTAEHQDPTACTYSNWTLSVTAGGTAVSPLDEVWDASRYRPTSLVQGTASYTGTFGSNDYIAYNVLRLRAGDTLYVTAEALTDGFDPYLRLFDEESFYTGTGDNLLAENDDADGLNSALEYPVSADGVYILVVGNFGALGDYRLNMSVNAPVGAAPPTEPTTTTDTGVIEVVDIARSTDKLMSYGPYDLNAGDTIYVFAAPVAPNSQLDPRLAFDFDVNSPFYDPNAPFLIEDDDSGGGLNSYFTYTVTETAAYQVWVGFFAGVDEQFRLIIAINQPEAFTEATGITP